MPFKRLFIGCFIDSSDFSDRYRTIKNDFHDAVSGKWTSVENLHFTIKFLGETDADSIPGIKSAIKSCAPEPLAVDLKLGGLDFFTKENPRILYLKADDKGGVLSRAFSAIEDRLAPLGFDREKRGFTPHITLMRIKNSVRELFIKAVSRHSVFDAGRMTQAEICLVESVLEKSGAVYKKI